MYLVITARGNMSSTDKHGGNDDRRSLAAFLLGYPDNTTLAQVTNPAMNGLGYSYAFFGQDDWKVTPYLTINAGFRYEIHPPLKDTHYNTAAFLPDYDEQGIHGGVAVPNAQGLTYTNPGFAASIAPTPILTAAQAGLPEKLRYTYKSDYGPRSALRGGRTITTAR